MAQIRLILLISFANLFFQFLSVGFCECRRIVWQQRTNIGDALNWNGDVAPCSSDSVVFPQKSYDLIKLSNFTTKELILPRTGGFIMDSQMSLNFREKDTKCRKNEVRTYKSVIPTAWLSSDNWMTTHDGNENVINAATPHDERIPCDNDDIIFPVNSSYAVDLQSFPFMTFKTIAIDGRIMTLNEFKDFLFSSYGESTFKNTDNTQFIENQECHDSIKCHLCHQNQVDVTRSQLCENVKPFCQPIPHCSDPIKPIGHCCNECGALFQMKLPGITWVNGFSLESFKSDIEKAINTAIATSVVKENQIVYHNSVTTEANQLYLQLIIVDRYEYNEQSTRLMDYLKGAVLNKIYKNQSKFYFTSGLPFTPNESGHVLAFIFGTFFLVTLFMTLIYIVYYDDRHLPRLIAMIRNRRFMHQSNVIFARFDNTTSHVMTSTSSNNDHDDDCGSVDLHFGTGQSIENVNRAFNNPMYDADATANVKTAMSGRDNARNDSDLKGDGGKMDNDKDECEVEEAVL